ncbi:NAD-dependent epimerase/dehydratase family protein [Nonomuraea sp. NPDC047529]|uniref:NAD-dependent epimerase/dehydratase family protein n=1 Tax=Nonomuraea sp. NPDC047529 TaxID=3155623 RepID=UPI0033DB5F3C
MEGTDRVNRCRDRETDLWIAVTPECATSVRSEAVHEPSADVALNAGAGAVVQAADSGHRSRSGGVVRALVTGAAGFIGSHLVERLLAEGHCVRGIDCFSDFYSPALKRGNLAGAVDHPRFEFVNANLARVEIDRLLGEVDVVFHMAGQPGVRTSWGDNFAAYGRNNVGVTQRLLEAASRASVRRMVFASSSSVYGEQQAWPTGEEAPTLPANPYGVTKLAAEHLCRVYARSHQFPVVSLRYFTVYGPRQRPDMALHRMLRAAWDGVPFRLFGDGDQVRDLTFVADVVTATIAAGTLPVEPGAVLNVAGGSATSVKELISMVEEVVGLPVPILGGACQPGDVSRTGGAIERIKRVLCWSPRVELREGVRAHAEWYRRCVSLQGTLRHRS